MAISALATPLSEPSPDSPLIPARSSAPPPGGGSGRGDRLVGECRELAAGVAVQDRGASYSEDGGVPVPVGDALSRSGGAARAGFSNVSRDGLGCGVIGVESLDPRPRGSGEGDRAGVQDETDARYGSTPPFRPCSDPLAGRFWEVHGEDSDSDVESHCAPSPVKLGDYVIPLVNRSRQAFAPGGRGSRFSGEGSVVTSIAPPGRPRALISVRRDPDPSLVVKKELIAELASCSDPDALRGSSDRGFEVSGAESAFHHRVEDFPVLAVPCSTNLLLIQNL